MRNKLIAKTFKCYSISKYKQVNSFGWRWCRKVSSIKNFLYFTKQNWNNIKSWTSNSWLLVIKDDSKLFKQYYIIMSEVEGVLEGWKLEVGQFYKGLLTQKQLNFLDYLCGGFCYQHNVSIWWSLLHSIENWFRRFLFIFWI